MGRFNSQPNFYLHTLYFYRTIKICMHNPIYSQNIHNSTKQPPNMPLSAFAATYPSPCFLYVEAGQHGWERDMIWERDMRERGERRQIKSEGEIIVHCGSKWSHQTCGFQRVESN